MKLVSIIIPTYNCEKYIAEAINSALNQTYTNLEILVIDDGSTDNTIEVLECFKDKIKYFKKEHSGISETRNYGISKSSSDLIAFLDADDIWLPNKTTLQVESLNQNMDLVFGHIENFLSPDCNDTLDYPKGRIEGFHPGAMLARKTIFEQVGLFNKEFKVGEFVDWLSRVRDLNIKYTVINELVMKRRVHSANTTRSKNASDYLAIVKARLNNKKP